MLEEQEQFLNRMKEMKKLRDKAAAMRNSSTTPLPTINDGSDNRLEKAREELKRMNDMKKLRDLARKINEKN